MPTSSPPETGRRGAAAAESAPPDRVRVLGTPVDLVTPQQALARLVDLVEQGRTASPPATVVTVNPEMVMLARRDQPFADILESAALLVPDGIGLVRALRRRGLRVDRVGGVDLLEAYLPVAAERHHRVALAGGGAGVAERAADRIRMRVPGIEIVAAEGGRADAALAARLQEAGPDLVCAAFGHGRQERFLVDHLAATGAGAGIGVGGWLDYEAGVVPRAPAPLRDAGLEWLFRLVRQPGRLPRQLVLPRFWVLERREARLLQRRPG